MSLVIKLQVVYGGRWVTYLTGPFLFALSHLHQRFPAKKLIIYIHGGFFFTIFCLVFFVLYGCIISLSGSATFADFV